MKKRKMGIQPTEKKQILLVCDVVGHSKVGMGAMQPILSYLGFPTFNLPTALVSNNFAYGTYSVINTSTYIAETIQIWKDLGFTNDAICTGWMYDKEQAQMVADYCREQRKKGSQIFVDPVMGDGGQLYNGMSDEQIEAMRRMVSVADLIFPNYTEACLLTDTPYQKDGLSWNDTCRMIEQLRQLGSRSVLITSCRIDGQNAVAGYNHSDGTYFQLPYSEIPIQFPGTGDIFSAILISQLLNNATLEQATQKAMDTVYQLIDLNKDNADINEGIPIEKYLYLL